MGMQPLLIRVSIAIILSGGIEVLYERLAFNVSVCRCEANADKTAVTADGSVHILPRAKLNERPTIEREGRERERVRGERETNDREGKDRDRTEGERARGERMTDINRRL